MNLRRAVYRVHKWLAVGAGLFLITWLISGIVMILPNRLFQTEPQYATREISYGKVVVSPAQALAGLELSDRQTQDVRWIGLRQIGEAILYEISFHQHEPILVDAVSGHRFTLTKEAAEGLIRERYPTQAATSEIQLQTEHSLAYAWGALPAYRFVFDDRPSIYYYAAIHSGDVQQSTPLSRARTAISSLHTFEPLRLIFEQDRYRKGFLLLFGLVGIGVAVTGYYMAIVSTRWVFPTFKRFLRRLSLLSMRRRPDLKNGALSIGSKSESE